MSERKVQAFGPISFQIGFEKKKRRAKTHKHEFTFTYVHGGDNIRLPLNNSALRNPLSGLTPVRTYSIDKHLLLPTGHPLSVAGALVTN